MTPQEATAPIAPAALTSVSRPARPWGLYGLAAAGAAAFLLIYRALEPSAHWLTYGLMGLTRGTHLADAVNSFIYDTAKIFLLLVTVIYAVTLIRQSFSPQRVRRALGGRREGIGNIMAAALGVVTPFWCFGTSVPKPVGRERVSCPCGSRVLPATHSEQQRISLRCWLTRSR
jgi:hypothetical protein